MNFPTWRTTRYNPRNPRGTFMFPLFRVILAPFPSSPTFHESRTILCISSLVSCPHDLRDGIKMFERRFIQRTRVSFFKSSFLRTTINLLSTNNCSNKFLTIRFPKKKKKRNKRKTLEGLEKESRKFRKEEKNMETEFLKRKKIYR